VANEDEDPVIAAVLLELSLEDEGLARQAEAALDWMTWRREAGRSPRTGSSNSSGTSCRSSG